MADEMQMVLGSPITVVTLSASLAAAANTYTGSGLGTELDNSTLLYPYAKAVLSVPETFAAAPAAGANFGLYMTRNDIDGTSDHLPVPASTDLKNAHYVGQFPIAALDVIHLVEIVISLVGVVKAYFYIKNNTGQATTYSASPLTVKVTPFTYKPTA